MNDEKSKSSSGWWRSLTEECPITLESLAALPYPPFALVSKSSHGDRGSESLAYFDGLALASYIVARGIFQNPLTRQELTMADCRRLDKYLDEYCYNAARGNQVSSSSTEQADRATASNLIGNPLRKLSVAEAFAIQQRIHVDGPQGRAEALQRTATAALAGLFVYGSHGQQNQREVLLVPSRYSSHEEQLVQDWGFDLRRRVADDSTFRQDGWTVIDDDEAHVVASQQEAYQATQRAFPPLSPNATSVENDANPDQQLLQTVRALSLEEAQRAVEKERQLAAAQQRRVQEAQERQDARAQRLAEEREKRKAKWNDEQHDAEELRLARAEIEEWRNQHWEKLRAQSEALAHKGQQASKLSRQAQNLETITGKESTIVPEADDRGDSVPADDILARKKAKAAAKRKRAKERKKEQKAKEKEDVARTKAVEALVAKKEASSKKCAACHGGILDCGFEKFNQLFCSPKCARSAKPNK